MTVSPGNSQNRSFTPRRFDGPRKVRGGIKLAGTFVGAGGESLRANAAGQNPNPGMELARRLIALVEARLEPAVLAAGLEYARSGQTVSVEFLPGVIEAAVQGSAPRPYVTRLKVPVISSASWPGVIEAMAAEAVHVAKLLSGELPATLDDLMKSLDLALLPAKAEEVSFQCSCGFAAEAAKQGRFCKHAATAVHVSAERLAAQPLLIFTLLGMPSERLLEQLRQARAMQTNGVTSAHGDAPIGEMENFAVPLEACLDEFWRSPARSHDLAEGAPPPLHHVPHALLRRLGPSPMNGRFPMVGLLASVYDTVGAAARRMQEAQDAAAAPVENAKEESDE